MKNGIVVELKTRKFHVRYLEKLTRESRLHRRNQTEAEKIVWEQLLRRKQLGVKFVRQKAVDRFILDFYCADLCLAIEIDGDYHLKIKDKDDYRDKFLQACGIRTLRFTNTEVLTDLNKVKSTILEFIHPALSREGMGNGF